MRVPQGLSEKPSGDTLLIVLVDQDCPPIVQEDLTAYLVPDEIERAGRYATRRLQERYIARRGMLRYIAGQLAGVVPQAVRIVYGAQGKPHLEACEWHANVSHSEHLAIIGMARSPIGVDIEAVTPLDDLEDVARYHFAPEEQAALFALPDECQQICFYSIWTRKEAFIKMDGRGLGVPLSSFAVTVHPDEAPRLLRSDVVDAHDWHIMSVPAPDNFVISAVVGSQITGYKLVSWL